MSLFLPAAPGPARTRGRLARAAEGGMSEGGRKGRPSFRDKNVSAGKCKSGRTLKETCTERRSTPCAPSRPPSRHPPARASPSPALAAQAARPRCWEPRARLQRQRAESRLSCNPGAQGSPCGHLVPGNIPHNNLWAPTPPL